MALPVTAVQPPLAATRADLAALPRTAVQPQATPLPHQPRPQAPPMQPAVRGRPEQEPRAGATAAPAREPQPPSAAWATAVLIAVLVAVAGAATIVPGVVAVGFLALAVLARTVDRSAAGLWRRRSERGASLSSSQDLVEDRL